MNNPISYFRNALLGIIACAALTAYAVPLPIQSPATPQNGVPALFPVEQAGSDAAAATFQSTILPLVNPFSHVGSGLDSTWTELPGVPSFKADPNAIVLATDYAVRAYFVGSGGAFANGIAASITGPGTGILPGGLPGSAQLLFPDTTTADTTYLDGDTVASLALRTADAPVLPGDFTELDAVPLTAGTAINNFIFADGANGGGNAYGSFVPNNVDGYQHVLAFGLTGTPYVLLGFEDGKGSGADFDYNDALIVLDIGLESVELLTPEPSTYLMLFSFLGIIGAIFNRKKRGLHQA